jgi:hypothetical protein
MARDQGGIAAVYHTAAADVFAESDGTVVLRFHQGCRLNAQNTRELLHAHVAAAAGSKRATLADLRGMLSADRDARELGAGVEASDVTSCMALVIGNPLTRLLANFFLRVTNPVYPTKLFTDEAAARAWLQELSK